MDTNEKKRTETDRSRDKTDRNCQTHTEMDRIGQNRIETGKKKQNKEYGKKLTETERNWGKKDRNGNKRIETNRNRQKQTDMDII